MWLLGFLVDLTQRAALWPWGRHSFQQKWVPGVSPGGKSCRCVRLTTLPPLCADYLQILGVSTSRSHTGTSRDFYSVLLFCGVWRHVVWYIFTYVSKEPTASILNVEDYLTAVPCYLATWN